MSRRTRMGVLAAIVFGALPLAHCKEPTAIRLVISTNVPWVEGSRVAIYATSSSNVEVAGAQSLQEQWGARGPDGSAQVGSITVVPTNGDSSAGAIRVVMGIGRDPDTRRLDSTQKRRLHRLHHGLNLRRWLRRRCEQLIVTCSPPAVLSLPTRQTTQLPGLPGSAMAAKGSSSRPVCSCPFAATRSG